MKKTMLVLLILISSTFAQNLKTEIDKVISNPTDSVILLYMSTNWRSHLDFVTYEATKFKDSSNLIWVFNLNTGVGTMYDETPSITSFYDIVNFHIDNVYSKYEKGTLLMITALIKSDVGNYYGIILNDNQNQLTFSGPTSSSAVTREYDVIDVFIGTALELRKKLNE